jgi:hypothetical protein
MKRFRISILGAMGLVLVAGLVLALVRIERRMVRTGLEGWANVARYTVVTSLVMATYRARYHKGREADWWFGFALGGWSYYLFSGDMMWQWAWPTHMPSSLVQSLPHWIVSLIPRYWMDQIVLTYSFLGVPENQSYVTRIVQALLVLSAAFVGGLVCLVLSWRRGARPRGSDPVVT